MFAAAAIGATAGTGYVTGFTVLQENVADEMRGRIFATLYTVVRLCLLLALTLSPFFANLLGNIAQHLTDGSVDVAGLHVELPGVRLALWAGGLVDRVLRTRGARVDATDAKVERSRRGARVSGARGVVHRARRR